LAAHAAEGRCGGCEAAEAEADPHPPPLLPEAAENGDSKPAAGRGRIIALAGRAREPPPPCNTIHPGSILSSFSTGSLTSNSDLSRALEMQYGFQQGPLPCG
jgi:hypothetical protein